MKILKIRICEEFIIEAFMTLVFVISAYYFGLFTGGCIYGCALLTFIIYNKNNLTGMFPGFSKRSTN